MSKKTVELDPNPVVDEATLLAEMESLSSDGEPETPPQGESQDPDDDEVEEDDEVEDEDADDSDDEEVDDSEEVEDEGDDEVEEDDEDEEEDDEEVIDEATQKVIAKHQEIERRSKEAIAKEREAFNRERREWLAAQDEVFTRLDKAKVTEEKLAGLLADPVGTLMSLGYEDSDLKQVAQDAWGHWRASEGDPEFANYKRRAAKDAQYTTKLDKANERIETLEKAAETARAEAAVEKFLSDATALVTDDHPVVKAWLASDAAEARWEMRNQARLLLEETGENPDEIDVINALEEFQSARLQKWGIDTEAVKKPRKKTKAPATTGKKKTAKTLTTKSVSKTKKPAPRPEQSLDEMAAEVLIAMRSGAIE